MVWMKYRLHKMPKITVMEFVPFWLGKPWGAGGRASEEGLVVRGESDGSAHLQFRLPPGHLPRDVPMAAQGQHNPSQSAEPLLDPVVVHGNPTYQVPN